MTTRRGRLLTSGKRFGLVVSRFNQFITKRLLDSTLETLEKAGVSKTHIDVVWVPGALEVPFFCQKLYRRKKFDALIVLACVLRGGTYHFECVANEITRGVSQVALETGIPIATGIITADSLEQAIDRAGLKAGNKGEQAALAAIEIADLNQQLTDGRTPKTGIRSRKKKNRKEVRK